MVAATRIITQEDALNSIKKRRGRPTVLETPDLIAGAQRGDSYRKAVNCKYALTGLALIKVEKGEDVIESTFYSNPNGLKFQGVLEQIGRMYRSPYFDYDEVVDLLSQILDDIKSGEKSKDIEQRLRNLRAIYEAARKNSISNNIE